MLMMLILMMTKLFKTMHNCLSFGYLSLTKYNLVINDLFLILLLVPPVKPPLMLSVIS